MQGSLNDLSPHTHTHLHLTMDNTDAAKSSTLPPLSLPWRTRLALSLLTTVTDACTRTNGTINRRILGFFSLRSPPNPTPIKGVKSSDVTVDPSRDLWFRIFTPTNSPPTPSTDPLPVIIFFHGGGFVHLSADSSIYDAVCRRFARTAHAVVVSVNYRLAPEHRYPAQYQDGFDVLKFLDEDESVRKLLPENADLSRCFLAGDSAGGNLSHNVAVKACQSKFQQLKVIGVVAIQPFFGGEERTEAEKRLVGAPLTSMKRTDWVWRAFLPPGEGLDRDHEAINVSGPNAIDLSSLEFPATLVIVAGYDALQDWQRRYYEWLKRAGKEVYLIEYPNMFHAFYIFPEVPESAKLITEVANFVHKCLKAQGGGGS